MKNIENTMLLAYLDSTVQHLIAAKGNVVAAVALLPPERRARTRYWADVASTAIADLRKVKAEVRRAK